MSMDVRANRSSVFASGTYKTGGGADQHLPIAESWSGLAMRGVMDWPKLDWSGVTELVKAELELTSTDQVHVARGSSPQADARRVTEQWDPNGSTDDGSGNWTTDPDVYPGPSSTSSGMVTLSGADANERTERWTVTAIVAAWAPTTVKVPGGYGGGAKQYGIALHQRDGSSRIAEWYSAKATSSKRPRLIVTTKSGVVPAAPTLQSPLGPMADARTFRFATSVAPTSWDLDLSTTSSFASPIWAPRSQAGGITGTSVAAPYAGPALVGGSTYWWRARARNANGDSPWSATGSFTPDPNPAGRDAWAEWARAILDAQADPRLILRPGTVRPRGPDVAPLVTADMATVVRVDLSDADAPMRSEALLVGLKVELDYHGWTLTPVLGGLGPTAADWYGPSPWYPDRVLGGTFAPRPTSYWGLGEPSGSFVDQVSGFPGTVYGTPTRGAAPLAGTDGALVSGVGHGATFGNLYNSPGALFTVLAWVTWDGSGESYILDKVAAIAGSSPTKYQGWRCQLASNGAPRLLILDSAGNGLTLTSPVVLAANTVHLVGWVRDGVQSRLYVDGERVMTGAQGPAPGSDASKLLTMGLNGAADELGYWQNVALTDDQVRALWRG